MTEIDTSRQAVERILFSFRAVGMAHFMAPVQALLDRAETAELERDVWKSDFEYLNTEAARLNREKKAAEEREATLRVALILIESVASEFRGSTGVSIRETARAALALAATTSVEDGQ